MANGFAASLRVELNPSACLVRFTAFIYLMAVSVCVITPAGWAIRGIAVCILVAYALMVIHKLTSENRVHYIQYQSIPGWQLKISGAVYPAVLLQPFYITHWLVVLSFLLPDGRKEKVVLLPDSAQSTAFRHLRVRLLKVADASLKND